MIELIIVIMLSRRNGRRAKEKGYSAGVYTFLSIVLYSSSEFFGLIVGYIILQDRLFIYPIGIVCGITGGVVSSLIVNSLRAKGTLIQDKNIYTVEDPEGIWECPSCQNENTNTSIRCNNCGYRII